MWALLLAAPPKWTTSKAPGCTPKDPSGRDMGCSNNPSTLTFHKDPIPHVPQEFMPSAAERVRREEAAAARRMTAAREAALEADLLTFAAERGAALDATLAAAQDDGAAEAGGGAEGATAARHKGLPAWRHGLALLGSESPPPAPPPPPPGGLRHDADLSVMSADAFASDSARLAELSLKGAPPYAVGAMRLETTPVPLPAPAGTLDPKRQWGGAPDGAAPGEPFVDADGAQ